MTQRWEDIGAWTYSGVSVTRTLLFTVKSFGQPGEVPGYLERVFCCLKWYWICLLCKYFFLIYILNVRIQVDKSCLVVNSRSDGTAVAIVIGATARVITVQLLHTSPALVDIRALLSGIAPWKLSTNKHLKKKWNSNT